MEEHDLHHNTLNEQAFAFSVQLCALDRHIPSRSSYRFNVNVTLKTFHDHHDLTQQCVVRYHLLEMKLVDLHLVRLVLQNCVQSSKWGL